MISECNHMKILNLGLGLFFKIIKTEEGKKNMRRHTINSNGR